MDTLAERYVEIYGRAIDGLRRRALIGPARSRAESG